MLSYLKKIMIAATAAVLIAPVSAKAEGENIIMVSGPLTDPFFSSLKKGVEDAAAQTGAKVQYSTINATDNVVADYARLLEAAVLRKPDALLVGNFFPDAVDPLIKQASENGIPVFVHNSGRASFEKMGAVAFIGEEPIAMGEAAAKEFLAKGAKTAICFNHVPSNPVLDERCKGFRNLMTEAGGSVKNVSVIEADAQNPQVVVQAIKGAIQANPGLDAIFTLGSSQAAWAVQAVKEQGKTGKIHVGTTDLSTPMLQSVIDGELDFLLDQQPYMQGYLSVISSVNFVRYGLSPVGTLRTGPMVINSANAAKVLEVNKGSGIRGAQ